MDDTQKGLVAVVALSVFGADGVCEVVRRPLEAGAATLAIDGGAVTLDVHRELLRDALAFRVCASVTEGRATLALAVEWTSPAWSRDGHLMMPAAVYAGNRFEGGLQEYPPMFPEARAEDGPLIITDVPRLEMEGPGRIELLAGDMAVPSVGWFTPGEGRARLLLGPAVSGSHPVGYFATEDENGLGVKVQVPGLRSHRYAMVDRDRPSPDRPAELIQGKSLELELHLVDHAASSLQELFDLYRKHRNGVLPPSPAPSSVPFSECLRILEKKYHAQNWDEAGGFFATEAHEDGPGEIQTGWVGGGIAGYALQRSGSPLARERGEREVRFIAETLQAENGFFHGGYRRPNVTDDSFGEPQAKGWHLLRKSADMMLFLAKRLADAPFASDETRAIAEGSLRRVADAFVRLWKENGQIGQFLDIRTGRIVIGGSTSAGTAPGGLALAGKLLGEPAYIAAAAEIAERYDARDVRAGITTGGPGEILQCPDSESCFGLLESFVILWEVTGDDRWAEKATRLAHQAATWVMPYDFPFPEDTLFGKLDMRTTGTVFANVQNKHSAPGICTLSAAMLVRLWRATKDEFLLDLAVQITRALPQYLSREDRPIGPLPTGWICERVNTSDWELGGIGLGDVFKGSCWCESSLLLSCVELPSILVHPLTRTIRCFDHLEIVELAWSDDAVRLTLHNPTAFDARGVVQIDGEGTVAFSIPSGETVEVGNV